MLLNFLKYQNIDLILQNIHSRNQLTNTPLKEVYYQVITVYLLNTPYIEFC